MGEHLTASWSVGELTVIPDLHLYSVITLLTD